MPRTGPITRRVESPPNHPVKAIWRCACGSEAESIDTQIYGEVPATMPGYLLQECTCPKCIECGWVIDSDGRCDNLDCALVGVHIVLPD